MMFHLTEALVLFLETVGVVFREVRGVGSVRKEKVFISRNKTECPA